jgi:hypothetical protein
MEIIKATGIWKSTLDIGRKVKGENDLGVTTSFARRSIATAA